MVKSSVYLPTVNFPLKKTHTDNEIIRVKWKIYAVDIKNKYYYNHIVQRLFSSQVTHSASANQMAMFFFLTETVFFCKTTVHTQHVL